MTALDRSIFRERAIEKYMQRQDLQVVLRLVSPPVFLFLWAFLALAFVAIVLTWSIHVPVFVSGEGMVIKQQVGNSQEVAVLLLFPLEQHISLRVGQPVRVSIASTSITSTIERADGAMSPDTIRKQFNLQSPLAQLITAPSITAIARIKPASLAQIYLGSQCQVRVQVGSESALSLLPDFGKLIEN